MKKNLVFVIGVAAVLVFVGAAIWSEIRRAARTAPAPQAAPAAAPAAEPAPEPQPAAPQEAILVG